MTTEITIKVTAEITTEVTTEVTTELTTEVTTEVTYEIANPRALPDETNMCKISTLTDNYGEKTRSIITRVAPQLTISCTPQRPSRPLLWTWSCV